MSDLAYTLWLVAGLLLVVFGALAFLELAAGRM